jgi:hypothetical protein
MVICYWEEAEERETGGTEDGKTGETRKTPEDDGRRWTDDGRQTADGRTVSDPLAHARGHKAATDDGKAERLKAATLSSSSACQGTRLRGSADGGGPRRKRRGYGADSYSRARRPCHSLRSDGRIVDCRTVRRTAPEAARLQDGIIPTGETPVPPGTVGRRTVVGEGSGR